jgi:hypothetical protein
MNNILILFPSHPPVVGEASNTTFSITPTEITEADAMDFFRYDHTPILFTGGHSKGENFEYATAIPFDIDNSHSDNPADWVYPEEIVRRLQAFGINYRIVASRNHLIPKEKNGVIHAARPKFHVYLPLAAPLYDADKFVRYCDWCIKTFGSDPQVKSKSQKIFGNKKFFLIFLRPPRNLTIRQKCTALCNKSIPILQFGRKRQRRELVLNEKREFFAF